MSDGASPKPHLAGIPNSSADDQLSRRVRSLRLPDEANGGRSSKLPWVLVLVMTASTAGLGYLYFQQQQELAALASVKKESASKAAAAPKAAKTATATTSAPPATYALEAKGYVVPVHQILVSPKVSGMVVKLDIIESQRVQKGDVLAELEDTEYRADRDRAKAMLESAKQNLAELERGFRPEEIAQAKAELAEAQAQLRQNEADYKRAAELLGKRVLSQEQYDATLSRYQAMQRRVQRLEFALKLFEDGPRVERINAARAQVDHSSAELAKAQWKLDNCIIRAPISGTILKKNAEEGSLVNPIAMQGFFSLCEMADLNDLEIDLTIQERDIAKVFPGQKCRIRAEAFPDRVFNGEVSRIMPTADRAKGAIPVRVRVEVRPGDEGILKPEMGALVSFLSK